MMREYTDLPEVYERQCRIPFRIVQAVIYYLEPIRLPIPFYDASGGPFTTVPVECWVELTDENGCRGQAPCGPLMKERILPLAMTGKKLTHGELYRTCYWAVRNSGFSGETVNELGRLDLALHDLMANRAGLPLHKLLGAGRDWAKVYASASGTNQPLSAMVEEMGQFLDRGYDCFKIKVGTDFGTKQEQDVEKIRVARETIGKDCRLAIDVNQIWDADQAMAFYDRVASYDIAWYEEPVHSHNFRELARLADMCPVPIGMGESVKNYYMLEEYVHCGVGQLQPIPTNLCGVDDWLKGRRLAYEKGIQFTSGGVSQLTASYIASGKEEDMVEYLTPVIAPLNGYMKRLPEERDGKFFLSDEPGAGLVPDLEGMKRAGLIRDIVYMG